MVLIRGGGLACGNIKHRGLKSATEDLRLVLSAQGTPIWIVERRHGQHHEPRVAHHELNRVSRGQREKACCALLSH